MVMANIYIYIYASLCGTLCVKQDMFDPLRHV